MRVVIQSGMHKNGNSSFTVSLHAAKDALRDAGFWVVPRGPRTNPGQPHGFDADWISTHLQEARDSGAQLFLIAHEALSLCSVQELMVLRRLLGPAPVRYVTVLRHWTRFLPSRWAQNSRVFDRQSFFAYFGQVMADPSRKDHSLHHTVTRALEAQMEDQVVVSFENALAQDGIVSAIWDACGLPLALLPAEQRAQWQAQKDGTELSDLMRLFVGLRPVTQDMPANPLSDRHADGSFDSRLLSRAVLAPQIEAHDPALFDDLLSQIAATKEHLLLTPDMFATQAEAVQTAVLPYLHNPIDGKIWPNPKSVEITASRLETNDLSAEIIARMRKTQQALVEPA